MRRTIFLAGVAIMAFTVSVASAQGVIFSGIPASVTSITPNHPNPGIPPSVTSLRPAPSNHVGFRGGSPEFQSGFHHHHHGVVAVPVPVYYPYYDENPVDYSNNMQSQPEQQPVAESPAPTIFESRPGYQAPPTQPIEPSRTEESIAPEKTSSKQEVAPPEPEPITVLVFRDGHEVEIGNYAIVGNTLYNLTGNYKAHKILLADLDLDKTAQVNEERGYEFRLPKQPGN